MPEENTYKEALSHKIFEYISEAAENLSLETYAIGGFVRDYFLERGEAKDIDIVAVGSGIALAEEVSRLLPHQPKVQVFKTYGTAMLRAFDLEVEFVGARRESYNENSRNPEVEQGSLEDDQNRRDFTINALAIEVDNDLNHIGEIIDLFGGQEDINRKRIRCVGDTHDRLQEDGLRLLRAARFIITKTVNPDEELQHALETSIWWQWLEETVSTERIREELHKMFKHDTQATMKFLVWNCNPAACRRLFSGDLWLKPHLGKK